MADLSQSRKPGLPLHRLKSPWTVVVAVLALVVVFDPGNLVATVRFAGAALLHTSVYILFAVLLLAGLKATGADVLVTRAFQGREWRMIVLAALFGGLAPFCSCEVIPFIAGLLALGAPLSAVMAFWLSSPLIDPPTLLITAGALGWPFAIAKAVAAVGLGLFGGVVVKALMVGGGLSEPLRVYQRKGCCGAGPKAGDTPVWRFWTDPARRAVFREEAVGNGVFLLKWLALAYVLEAVLVAYVPAEAIAAVDPAMSIVSTDKGDSLSLEVKGEQKLFLMRKLYIADGKLRYRDWGPNRNLGQVLLSAPPAQAETVEVAVPLAEPAAELPV